MRTLHIWTRQQRPAFQLEIRESLLLLVFLSMNLGCLKFRRKVKLEVVNDVSLLITDRKLSGWNHC